MKTIKRQQNAKQMKSFLRFVDFYSDVWKTNAWKEENAWKETNAWKYANAWKYENA